LNLGVALWISGAALIVSAASLAVSLVVAVRNARIQRAQIRTELLSKLVDLRLEYTRFVRRIRNLKENPPSPIPSEIARLLSAQEGFGDYERRTESYRQALLGSKRDLHPVKLEELRHYIEALLKQLADNNRHLDDILDSDSAAEKRLIAEQFNAIRRNILYINIVNDFPVALHKLRVFLIERGLVEQPGVGEFFSKWLTHPLVVMGKPAVNVFSHEAINELRGELDALRL
jgi:hypothetical protein